MKFRASGLGAKFAIKSAKGTGTSVLLEMPLNHDWGIGQVFDLLFLFISMAVSKLLYEDNNMLRESISSMIRLDEQFVVSGAFENVLFAESQISQN
ncbi:MAG: hypothetical protein U5K54_19385 [Cytophagales bacterium]|nr:hypothetical protein [Cytophagales bacterium]